MIRDLTGVKAGDTIVIHWPDDMQNATVTDAKKVWVTARTEYGHKFRFRRADGTNDTTRTYPLAQTEEQLKTDGRLAEVTRRLYALGLEVRIRDTERYSLEGWERILAAVEREASPAGEAP